MREADEDPLLVFDEDDLEQNLQQRRNSRSSTIGRFSLDERVRSTALIVALVLFGGFMGVVSFVIGNEVRRILLMLRINKSTRWYHRSALSRMMIITLICRDNYERIAFVGNLGGNSAADDRLYLLTLSP
jgi:hypothetical protein